MNQIASQTQSQTKASLLPGSGILQRKCACGNHTIAGGECAECAKKKNTLQRKATNQGELGARFSLPGIPVMQRKLTVGASNDPLEKEADQVADQVLAAPANPAVGGVPPRIQRFTGQPSGQMDTAPASVERVLASSGRPLDSVLRQDMGQRFGQDFSQVRVHSGAAAEQSARDVNANAYTVGHNVVFGAGQFAPGTHEGQRLIAHELTHVVQQGESTASVQRQEDDFPLPLGPNSAQPGQSSIPLPDVVTDPTALSEPNCPPTPTHLGNRTPTPACNEDGEDIDGNVFQFCADSDVFSDPADLGVLRTLVSGQPSGTSFRLRAYASVEGPGTTQNATLYNRNLSCHRMNRVIRELLNLGVQEQEIDAVSMGPTERFGIGVGARPLNRVVVIEADPPQHAPRADATGMTMEGIRDAAKQRIASGNYPLAADAYFARWSCGRWRTLAEAVARTTVQIEGAGAGDELGSTSGTGPNTIVISPRIAGAIDPIGCAANRIADLTFHHFARPVLSNFEDQHRAGMHLVHLAGLPECRIPPDPFNVAEVRSRPNPVDPFTGFIPRCADQPLPGPLGNQQGPATMETPPVFTVRPLTLTGTSGGVVPSGGFNPLTVGVEPVSPFEVHAVIDAVGAPASIASFEIGFVQTVIAENWINTHVDGRRERRRFPLPLRDGPRRNDSTSAPPWFDTNARMTASPGENQITLTDAPNFRAFQFLPDLPSSVFVQSINVPRPGGGRDIRLERPTFQPRLGGLLPANSSPADVAAEQRKRAALANNVPDRGSRVVNFNTWVVARRRNPPAPDTHGATQFLRGLGLTFRLNADWTSSPGGRLQGAGTYNVTSRPATDSDAATVMLRGATPLDFVGSNGVPLFAEFLDIDPPLARAQAGGLPRSAYFDAVRQVAQQHRTGPTMRGTVIIRINVEVATGRVILDTRDLQSGAIRVLGATSDTPVIDTPETRTFARAIFPEVRKLVAAPSLSTNEPQTGIMPVAIRLQPLGAP